MQSSEQYLLIRTVSTQHEVDTITMLNFCMMWLRHNNIWVFTRPHLNPEQYDLWVHILKTNVTGSSCLLVQSEKLCLEPASTAGVKWVGPHQDPVFLSHWLPSTTIHVVTRIQSTLCDEFLLPTTLGYPHIPNASPILLFAQTSKFVTWNDLLIVSFPLASFQGFVANVKCCLKNVFSSGGRG